MAVISLGMDIYMSAWHLSKGCPVHKTKRFILIKELRVEQHVTVTANARSDGGCTNINYNESNSTRFDIRKQNKLRFRGAAARQMAPFRQLPPLGAEPRRLLQVNPAFRGKADGPLVRKLLTANVSDKAVLFVSLIECINNMVLTAAEGEHVANKDRRDFFYRASLRAIFNCTSLRRQVAYERFSSQKSRTQ